MAYTRGQATALLFQAVRDSPIAEGILAEHLQPVDPTVQASRQSTKVQVGFMQNTSSRTEGLA
jgi:hypothetical protein